MKGRRVFKLEYFPKEVSIPKGDRSKAHLSRETFDEMVQGGVFEWASLRRIGLSWTKGEPYVSV